jgi:hypothetical protein
LFENEAFTFEKHRMDATTDNGAATANKESMDSSHVPKRRWSPEESDNYVIPNDPLIKGETLSSSESTDSMLVWKYFEHALLSGYLVGSRTSLTNPSHPIVISMRSGEGGVQQKLKAKDPDIPIVITHISHPSDKKNVTGGNGIHMSEFKWIFSDSALDSVFAGFGIAEINEFDISKNRGYLCIERLPKQCIGVYSVLASIDYDENDKDDDKDAVVYGGPLPKGSKTKGHFYLGFEKMRRADKRTLSFVSFITE